MDTRTAEDRVADQQEADAFFARTYTSEQIAKLQAGPTMAEIARWARDCKRARTIYTAQVAETDAAQRRANALRAGRLSAQSRRDRVERERQEQERRDARNARNRAWYADNKEQHAEYQRRSRERALASDPDGARAKTNARDRRWYTRHREEIRQKRRDTYWADPAKVAVQSARNYEQRKEIIKAQHKAKYWANHEQSLQNQRRYRAREKRRRELGLPVRATHRTPPVERKANQQAADAFFTRERTSDQVTALCEERPGLLPLIDPDEWQNSRFRRENTIARLLPLLATRRERADARHVAELVRAHDEEQQRKARDTARDAEEARMDAIARNINARLRTTPPSRRTHHNDPAAPHALPGIPGSGISR